MNSGLQSKLSKIKFTLGLNPSIEKRPDYNKFIPEPYKAVVLFQADFEMAWAWRFAKSHPDPLNEAEKMGLLERENIPEILRYCDQYNIPVTWAAVGHLFLESCARKDGLVHPELPRLAPFENNFWRFSGGDWFEQDPASNVKEAPAWYCPDLINMIMESRTRHEIGCHTFSHIDCRDEVCSPELLRAELDACRVLAQEKGIGLESFVHPGNTFGNIKTLAENGFSSYRTNYRNTLGYPVYHNEGIWELKSTMDLFWREQWSADYHVKRYSTIIERAVKNRSVCVLWFHPSFSPEFLHHVLPGIFRFIYEKQDQEIGRASCRERV